MHLRRSTSLMPRLACAALLVASAAAHAQTSSLQFDSLVLPVNLDTTASYALANDGSLVGWTLNASGSPLGFVYRNGSLKTVDAASQFIKSQFDIPASLGSYFTPSGTATFTARVLSINLFLGLTQEGLRLTETSPNSAQSTGSSFIQSVNVNGTSVGDRTDADPSSSGSFITSYFVQPSGGTQVLLPNATGVVRLNDSNQVLYASRVTVELPNPVDPTNPLVSNFSSFDLWDNGQVRNVALEDGDFGVNALDLGNGGDVLLEIRDKTTGFSRAGIWTDGVLTPIFTDLSFTGVVSGAVAANGDVAATLALAGGEGNQTFLYRNGQTFQVQAEGLTELQVLDFGLNNTILVNALSGGTVVTGLISNPVPEPSTYALIALGLGAASVAARRRQQRLA